MPVFLEPEEFELVPHRLTLGGELTKRRRDSTRCHGPSIRTCAGPKATVSFTLHRPIFWCVLLQVIMTIADTPAPKEAITAALLVIGDKILSGRTKDQNIGYVAEYLTALGMHLAEVRVIGDEETAIVDAVNALRQRYSYDFTTGGIGPTHDDITADSVAKAFGVPIDIDPHALAILHEWLKETGAEMTEARLRMTRIQKGADLVLNKVSGAPGFWIGNVIVMAGVPSIMQAMLYEVPPQPKTGVRILSGTVSAGARRGG